MLSKKKKNFNAVLLMFLSYWDKSRRIAAELLLDFPAPLPSYDTVSDVNILIASNLKLFDSELICSHFPNLIILCLSFNKIKDISHISNLYHIEVLDVIKFITDIK